MPRMPKKPSHLIIRLALHGCRNRPFYHIVLMQNRANRDAPPVEQLGTFDPMTNIHQEKLVALNFERLRFWLGYGANCSKPVESLLGLSGFLPIHPTSYMNARRSRKSAEEKKSELGAESEAQ